MNGRLLLPLLFIPLLLSTFNNVVVVGAAAAQGNVFYLIPVISTDGKTTQTGECIGALISLQHIIAPSKCLLVNGKQASGVFIDYRANKVYPEDKNLFPISEFTFSKNIEDNNQKFAVITLHVPFTEQNSLGISPIAIDTKGNGSPVHFERKAKSVEQVDGKGGEGSALIGGKDLTGFDGVKLDCKWIQSKVPGATCK